jgi:leucyl/phenylalanyl-tRNA---protein transferase
MTPITPAIVLQAYAAGLFPMAESANDPTLHWIDPEERGVIPLDDFHISRSLRKSVRKQLYEIRIDTAFRDVMIACATPARGRRTTWINSRIVELYTDLFNMGRCHSVEAWNGDQLLGGLYGVHIGAAFFGESMFSRATDASKVALVHLVARLNAARFRLLDAQFMNDHLVQFGAKPISRASYRRMLSAALAEDREFLSFNKDGNVERVLQLAQSKGTPSA